MRKKVLLLFVELGEFQIIAPLSGLQTQPPRTLLGLEKEERGEKLGPIFHPAHVSHICGDIVSLPLCPFFKMGQRKEKSGKTNMLHEKRAAFIRGRRGRRWRGGNQCAAAEREERGGVEKFSGTPPPTINLPSVGLEQRGRKTRVSPTYIRILHRKTLVSNICFRCSCT